MCLKHFDWESACSGAAGDILPRSAGDRLSAHQYLQHMHLSLTKYLTLNILINNILKTKLD